MARSSARKKRTLVSTKKIIPNAQQQKSTVTEGPKLRQTRLAFEHQSPRSRRIFESSSPIFEIPLSPQTPSTSTVPQPPQSAEEGIWCQTSLMTGRF